ncbi:MAG: hypothetical protein ABI741_06215 [Ferruginibacter sp.]
MLITTFNHGYSRAASKPSVITDFLKWCTAQEEDRILWTGLGLGIQGCITTPVTVLVLLIFGQGLGLFGIAMASIAMAAVLIVNLAALPTRITIPFFVVSLFVDIALVVAAFL